MGLDMTLYKKHYVKNWDHMKPEDLHHVTVTRGGMVRLDIKSERVSEITELVAEWRKANAIHDWFVKNVQGGNDDCKEYSVSKEELGKLVNLCTRVLNSSELIDGQVANGYTLGENGERKYNYTDGKLMANTDVAKELLPTTEGFFFGSTDYDEYYYNDIKYTRDTLQALLQENDNGYYSYQSSW